MAKSKVVSAKPGKSDKTLKAVKNGAVTKSSQTVKTKSGKIAKETAKKANLKKIKKADSSDEEDSDSGSSASSASDSDDSDSDVDSEVEQKTPSAKKPKKAQNDSDSDDSESGSDSDSEDDSKKTKANSTTKSNGPSKKPKKSLLIPLMNQSLPTTRRSRLLQVMVNPTAIAKRKRSRSKNKGTLLSRVPLKRQSLIILKTPTLTRTHPAMILRTLTKKKTTESPRSARPRLPLPMRVRSERPTRPYLTTPTLPRTFSLVVSPGT